MKVLIIIDMQNDFIDGVLGSHEARAIVPKVVKKIKSCDKDTLLLLTKDTHDSNYMDTLEGKKLPIPHCIEGTYGWSLNNEVSNAVKDFNGYLYSDIDIINSRILKNTFGSIRLVKVIKDIIEDDMTNPVASIELVGLDSDICVISNALLLKAFFPEIPITVDASCCAGVTPESHKNAIEAMKMCQIDIINEN